jgi:ParB family chromosome partitioning protein
MAQTEIHQLPLSELKIDPANVRTGDLKADPAFIASIREKDIIVPLTVRKNGDGYLVTDGGKRLAALQALVKEGANHKDRMVPVTLRDDSDADAVDTSLTTNYIRTAMHPVAEYEAFVKLEAGGMTAEQIAKRYNISAKGVKQRLALGRLAPEVRAAWRDDKLEEDEAIAFTLEPDQKRQAAVLASLSKRGHLSNWQIKRELVGEAHEAAGLLRLVGIDAYRAAGGPTAEDLFTEKKDAEIIATDLKLLKTLADKKIADTVEKLKAEGWKWVEAEKDLPSGNSWWDHKPKNQIKADDRSKYGVIVRQNNSGDLDNHYGVVKPSEQKAAAKKKAVAKGEAPEAAISAALAGRLSQQITRAAAAVLETDAQLALAAIAAALTCYEGPVQIEHKSGSSGMDDDEDVGLLDFDAQLALFRKKSIPDLAKVLARLAATSLSMGGHVQTSLPLAEDREEDRCLLEALDAKKLNAQLRANFDAADYFTGMTAQVCKDAIALCDPKYPFTGKEKKSELAALAADLVKKSNAGGKPGYLPPEMRTKAYDGPKPKAAHAKKPAKKGKS